MKTKLLLMILVMMVATTGAACARQGVVLTLRSGGTVSFAFDRRPVMITGCELTMQTANGMSVSYAYDEVENVRWGEIDDLTKVVDDATLSSGDNIVFRLRDGGIEARGLMRGQILTAYSIDGRVVSTVRAADAEPTILPLPDEKGVFVIRTSTGVSLKISK